MICVETDKTPDYICRHVCQSFDGVTQHKAGSDSYDIILNDLETADGEEKQASVLELRTHELVIFTGTFGVRGCP